MITVNDIRITLGDKTIVQDVSFQILQGKILMLLGENGCGKTTLIKGLLQEYPLAKGSVTFNGSNVQTLSYKQRAAVFSYIPQIKEMVDQMTCKDVIVSGLDRFLHFLQIPGPPEYAKAKQILQQFQIEEVFDQRIDQISGGQLQLVYLCRAFLQDASCILMDEPCTYLDFIKQHAFLEHTRNLTKQGHSVVISIHDPNLALAYGDEILFMHQGKLLADIKKEETDMRQALRDLYQKTYQREILF